MFENHQLPMSDGSVCCQCAAAPTPSPSETRCEDQPLNLCEQSKCPNSNKYCCKKYAFDGTASCSCPPSSPYDHLENGNVPLAAAAGVDVNATIVVSSSSLLETSALFITLLLLPLLA